MNEPRKKTFPTEVEAAHQKACAAKELNYEDPITRETHFTEFYLTDRGFCCNQGCRHCPYWGEPQIRVTYKDGKPIPTEKFKKRDQ